MKCPNCGSEAQGKFCSNCGTPLEGAQSAQCASCHAALLPGAGFCTQCGAAVRHGGQVRPARMVPWLIGGAVVVVLGVTLLLRPPPSPSTPMPTAGTVPDRPAGSPPALTGSMRENADRLFNRIMAAREGGDTAQAKQFLPMAISAYQQAGDLDADGLYHLSILQTFGGDGAAGRATADQLLGVFPKHLLGLHAAANAARVQGDGQAARRYYQLLLDALPDERGKDLPEYHDHEALLPGIEAEAQAFLAR